MTLELVIGGLYKLYKDCQDAETKEQMLASLKKMEELADKQIKKMDKEEREKEENERFKKMLDFVLSTLIKKQNNDISERYGNGNLQTLTEIEKQIVNIKISNYPIGILILITTYDDVRKICCHTNSEQEMEENFYKNLNIRDASGKKIIDILKQELPKILTPDVFDGEKLIV